MQQYKTIGFFGDSFCAEMHSLHADDHGYQTYIQQLKDHYSSQVVNLGQGGSGIWDLYLNQLKPLIDKQQLPEVSVFVWSLSGRIFHRQVRRINSSDALTPQAHTYDKKYSKVWSAAKQFYEYLYDQEKEDIEYLAVLQYLDREILSAIKDRTKIVHLWAFGKMMGWGNEFVVPSKISYIHRFSTGVEIRPSLLSLSLMDSDIGVLQTDRRANHLDGIEKNQMLFQWIKEAVDNHSDGLLLDHSEVVNKLWHEFQARDHRAI